MKTISAITLGSLIGALAIGCTPMDNDNDYDPALLAEYRTAVPDMATLRANAPQASMTALVGDPALYPTSSYGIVAGINGSVEIIIGALELITSIEPTIYNSATREFFWGPWENENGVGYMGAYLREAAPDSDFTYEYAVLRGIDNDIANLRPIVWGGASPDANNDDYGVGVTVWDFEANYAFEQDHNPNVDNEIFDHGRFATLWGKNADENDPDADFTFVVSVFRNFVSQDNPTAEAANLDYFYGRYEAEGQSVDFIDWQAGIDVSEPADGIVEDVGVRMAFVNEGTGRAEADATGGSLDPGTTWSGVECWNDAIARTYLGFEISGQPAGVPEGELADCGLFASTLNDLQIPSLEDLPADLLNALDQVAENGVPAE